MGTEMGEYAVGAYLRICMECDVIDYNARPPEKGLQGIGELDVIGLRFKDSTAFLCEVATHLDGLNYGSYEESLKRVKAKHDHQKIYADKNLGSFKEKIFMFWSPWVPVGPLTADLLKIPDLKIIINKEYSKCIKELRSRAEKTTKNFNNEFFRALQIIGHLKPEE